MPIESLNFVTFHRDPIRHEYLSGTESRDAFFDPLIKTWIVTDPVQCKDLLMSGNLRPVSFVEDYQILEKRLGIDFSSIIFAFDHIPVCLHGDPHTRSRRRASEILASRKGAINTRIPELVATHFDAFRSEGRLEVMGNVVFPLVVNTISTIIDIDLSAVGCLNVSMVFDKSVSVTKRRKLAADLASVRELISSRLGAHATEEDIGVRLALLALGRDALLGTLGESIYRLLQSNSGRRLLEIDYPDLPLETGVPFTERMVATPFKLANCDFASGDRVRIVLQSFAYAADPRSRTNFFGAGAHACLGRQISIAIWKSMTAVLSTIPLRAHIVSYSPRTSDYLFTCPQQLEVDLRR